MARRASKLLVPTIVGLPAVVLGAFFMSPSFAATTEPADPPAPVLVVTTQPAPAPTGPRTDLAPMNRPQPPTFTENANGGCINCLDEHSY